VRKIFRKDGRSFDGSGFCHNDFIAWLHANERFAARLPRNDRRARDGTGNGIRYFRVPAENIHVGELRRGGKIVRNPADLFETACRRKQQGNQQA
jgi:hypothetical protein